MAVLIEWTIKSVPLTAMLFVLLLFTTTKFKGDVRLPLSANIEAFQKIGVLFIPTAVLFAIEAIPLLQQPIWAFITVGVYYVFFVPSFYKYYRQKLTEKETAVPAPVPVDQRPILQEAIEDDDFKDAAIEMVNENPNLKATDILAAYKLLKLPQRTNTGLLRATIFNPTTDELNVVMRVHNALIGLGVEKKERSVDFAVKEGMQNYPLYSDLLKTPLWRVLSRFIGNTDVPIKARMEGTFILAPPGSGKTTLIEYLATRDMQDQNASVVVMDSQSTIINELATLSHIQDRVILIEPGTVAMNPFSMKGEVGVDLITFILGALGGEGATLTSKQSSFYRPCVRLLQEVPQATFADFYGLLQPNGLLPYTKYLPNLSQTVQLFFRNEFDGKGNAETKNELMWRLRPITEDTVYERMFCAPETKLDLFTELDAGKVILIDTNKQALGAVRSSLFGRMFVAFLYRAVMQRQAGKHPPVYAFIDEAHEYLQDDQIADMLDEVRKRNVAMTLATQRMDKIKSTNMKSAVLSTAVKYVRAGNNSDAHTLATEMGVRDAGDLQKLEPRSFMLFVRDVTRQAVAIRVPDFDIKSFTHVSIEPLRRRMKELYGADPKPNKPEPPDEDPDDGDDDITPSKKL